MADNTVLIPGTTGDTIRTIARAGIKTPVSVIDLGGEAGPEALLVSGQQAMAASIPVVIASNQSTLTVAGSGTFTVAGTVTANQGGAWTVATNADCAVGNGSAPSKALLTAGVFNSVLPTLTNGQTVGIQVDSSGRLLVGSVAGTVTVAGTITANQGGSWTVTANAGSGTFTTSDSHFPAAAALADNLTNPTTTEIGANLLAWDATNSVWRRVQVDAGTGTLKVDPGTVTVTGAITANQGGAPWSQNLTQINSVALGSPSNYGTSPGAVSVAGVNAFVTNTVTISGTVTANVGTTNGLALDTSVNGILVAQGSTTSGEKGPLIQGAVTTNAPSYTTAQTSPLSLDTSGLLRASLKDTPSNTNNLNVNLAASAATVTVSGTVTTTPPANASTNVAQFGGNAVVTGTGAGGNGIPRVTVSNDSTIGLVAGTAVIGHVILDPTSASGGLSTYFNNALSTTVSAVKALAGRLYNLQVQNPNSSDAWVQVFDLATGSVTLGTTTPKKALFIPALGESVFDWDNGVGFATAISVAATTTSTGNTAPTTALVFNADFV